jgi:hypothetical protein
MPAIPERQPIGDPFDGVLLSAASGHVLAAAPLATAASVSAAGRLIVRYGLPYLGKPHLSIVPGLVALDYGDILTGEEAWDFLIHRSNLYPRADVVGYRNDGQDDMIVVKLLDLAEPVQVLVYPDDQAAQPLARVSALIAPATAAIPPRLLQYLPRYDSLEAWQQHE